MTFDEIENRARELGLTVLGAFHPDPPDDAPDANTGTIVLLGPDEPGGFWELFTMSSEYADGAPDPMNRWSERVFGALADALPEGEAAFPFGGPPYRPFLDWAEATGSIWASPVTLLVHPQAGLWVSFRGALVLQSRLDLPPPGERPCETCAGQPCRTACPVDALTPGGYDVPRCQAYVRSPEGADCRTRGCAVRRACPISASWGREDAQAAFHMEAFLT